MPIAWNNISSQPAIDFTCWRCGREISSVLGFQGGYQNVTGNDSGVCFMMICPRCNFPTLFIGDERIPGERFGDTVAHLPSDIGAMYDEARGAMSVSAWTAAVMVGRKILMNVAVAQGADEGKTFVHYVDYLVTEGIVTTAMKDWVDEIRKLGNEANHEIELMTREQAVELLTFLAMMLKIVYEYPEKGRQSVAARAQGQT